MCKPQEISNWLRSVYRISAGKWIPGRNKNLHCFVDFWEIEGIWTRIKIEEAVEAFVNLWNFSLPADSASFSVLWCGLLLLLFFLFLLYVFLPHFLALHPLFLVFTACESQCKILKLVVSEGKWKRQSFLCSLFTHPNGHVSLTWPVVYVSFPGNSTVRIFNSKKSTLVYIK